MLHIARAIPTGPETRARTPAVERMVISAGPICGINFMISSHLLAVHAKTLYAAHLVVAAPPAAPAPTTLGITDRCSRSRTSGGMSDISMVLQLAITLERSIYSCD